MWYCSQRHFLVWFSRLLYCLSVIMSSFQKHKGLILNHLMLVPSPSTGTRCHKCTINKAHTWNLVSRSASARPNARKRKIHHRKTYVKLSGGQSKNWLGKVKGRGQVGPKWRQRWWQALPPYLNPRPPTRKPDCQKPDFLDYFINK